MLCVVGVSTAAHAQVVTDIDLRRFRPTLDQHGFATIQGTTMPGSGRWDVGLWFDYDRGSLVLRDDEGTRIRNIVDHRLSADFTAQVGITDRFALGFDLPLVLHQVGDLRPLGDDSSHGLTTNAVGDPRILGRVRILGQDGEELRERNDGPGVAALAVVTLPLGTKGSFATEGAVTFDLHAIADFHFLGLGVVADLGWRHRFINKDIGGVTFRDRFLWGFGIKVPIPLGRGLAGMFEIRGEHDARRPFQNARRSSVEGDLGIRYGLSGLSLTALFGMGFASGIGTPSYRATLGVMWSPRFQDADGDSIQDADDNCPYFPEDYDDFEDEDGCDDPDNDGDYVPDLDDECPFEEAEEGRDWDENGCTDPLRDDDRDGIDVVLDACPTRPEDMDGFEDDDGCPEPGP